jgi:hypothetical protein
LNLFTIFFLNSFYILMTYYFKGTNISDIIDKTVNVSQNIVINGNTFYNSFPGATQANELSLFNPSPLNYAYNGTDVSTIRCAVFKDFTSNVATQIIAPVITDINSQPIIPTKFTAICIGGGGGGGGGGSGHQRDPTNTAGGGGGGGGGASYGVLYKYPYNSSITANCGQGGAGGSNAQDGSNTGNYGGNGSPGQPTYIQSPNVQGNLILVPGGSAGIGGDRATSLNGAAGVQGSYGGGGAGGGNISLNTSIQGQITAPYGYVGSAGGAGGGGNQTGGTGGTLGNINYLYTRIPINNNGKGGAGGAGGNNTSTANQNYASQAGQAGSDGLVRIFYLYE